MARDHIRKCNVCGKPVEVDCWYSDYGLVKLDNSGTTYIEFDACPECLKKIVGLIKNELKYKEKNFYERKSQ